MNANEEAPPTPARDEVIPLAASDLPRKRASRLLLALIILTLAVTGLIWGIGAAFYGHGAKVPSAIADAHTRDLAADLAAVVAVSSVVLFVGLRKHRSRAMVLAVIVPMQVGALGWLMSAFG